MENLHGLNTFGILAIVTLATCTALLIAKVIYHFLNFLESAASRILKRFF